VLALAFAPTGRTLLAWVSDSFAVWDLDTNQRTITWFRRSHHCGGFEFDPLGRWIYVADEAGLRFYPPPFREFQRLTGEEDDPVLGMTVDWSGTRLVVSCGLQHRNRLECWDVAPDGDIGHLWSRPASYANCFSELVFSPDGSCIAALQSGSATITPVVTRDASTGAVLEVLGKPSDARSLGLVFTSDGRYLLYGSPVTIAVYDLAEKRFGNFAPRFGNSHFTDFAVHPTGKFFATSGGDRCVRLWSLPECQPRGVLKWDIGKLRSITMSRDGMLAAAGGEEGKIAVWDVEADV
jgi:WD40 repeat protein